MTPMTDLVKIPFGEHAVSLDLPSGLTEQEWKQIGHRLLRCKDALQFWIGDWINYGVAEYGEKYKEAIRIFGDESKGEYGYELKTFENFASVAKRVQSSLRREKLSYGHHAAVASYSTDEQDYWLGQAEEAEWSVADLNAHLRANDKQKPQGSQTSAMVGMWSFETWFSEFDRGFKTFTARAPLGQWKDDDLSHRIQRIDQARQPLVEEAKKRGLKVEG